MVTLIEKVEVLTLFQNIIENLTSVWSGLFIVSQIENKRKIGLKKKIVPLKSIKITLFN